MKKFKKFIAGVITAALFAGLVVMPAEAVNNVYTATLSNSYGRVRTYVNVGKTGSIAGDLALDHKFDAKAVSTIESSYAVREHFITLVLKKDGLQGSLNVGTSSGSVTISQKSDVIASFVSSKVTAKSILLETHNNNVKRTVWDNAAVLASGPLMLSISYFTVTGTAISSARIGNNTYTNTVDVTSYN